MARSGQAEPEDRGMCPLSVASALGIYDPSDWLAQSLLGREEEREPCLEQRAHDLLTKLALGTEYPTCIWLLRSSPAFLLQRQTQELIGNVGF